MKSARTRDPNNQANADLLLRPIGHRDLLVVLFYCEYSIMWMVFINYTNSQSFLTFKTQAQTALFKDPVRTALHTLFISVKKPNQFMQ